MPIIVALSCIQQGLLYTVLEVLKLTDVKISIAC